MFEKFTLRKPYFLHPTCSTTLVFHGPHTHGGSGKVGQIAGPGGGEPDRSVLLSSQTHHADLPTPRVCVFFFSFRAGGKGTVRRKVVRKSKPSAAQDDKKLQGALKKLNVQPIPGVEEVNMFKEDGNVLHFTTPKGARARIIFSPSGAIFTLCRC